MADPMKKRTLSLKSTFKKESSRKLGDKRQVSLISLLGKLVGSIIKMRITNTEEQAFMRKNQHGFCKRKAFGVF